MSPVLRSNPWAMASACPPSGSERPIGQPVGVLADDVLAAVGASAVHDDVLDARVVLIEHRAEGALQELRLVEAGGDDGDANVHCGSSHWP